MADKCVLLGDEHGLCSDFIGLIYRVDAGIMKTKEGRTMKIKDIRQGVTEIAPLFAVKRIDLFGSYASASDQSESDIDLLVEFDTPAVSLLTLSKLQSDLEARLKKDVDLIHAPLPPDALIQIGKVIPLYESSGRTDIN